MPNWKKVIVSGSDASLNSLNVNTYISASSFSGKFTGSLQGSSSYALTSSYVQNAQTASYVVSASYAITASNAITASYALYAASSPNIGTTTTFTQATSASTWTFIHNLNTYTPQITVYDYGKNVIIPQNIAGTDANTVTINFNASQSGYAVISNGGGLVITGSSYYFTQASASSTWLIEHPLNTRTPIVQVYDPAYTSILTEYITALSNTLVSVTLPTSTTGFAVLSNGGNLFISGSSARLTQSIAAVTWSFTHSLNTKYPVVQVYDSTDTVIIPASIAAIDTNTTQLTFATPTTGVAVAEFSGIQNLQDNTVSSSYARNADTASYALNGGVTRIFAGPNITLAPTNGLGQVTITANLSGSTSYNTATGSYGSFYDTTTQTNPVANIPRSMSFNTTDITNGVSLSGSTNPFNTYIKIENPGVYNIQFSAQLDKTDSGKDEVVIWLRKNGIDLTDTATTLTLNGNDDKVVAAWNWFTNSTANDYYQIIWYSADTDLRILAETAGGGHPGIPSVILTVNRVDTFLSNTGSFSGSFNGNFNGSGSGTFIGSFTGSLFGTASQAVSSSYAITSSFAPSYTLTSSFLAFTSSVNATTGALNATTGALNATTGALNATTGALNATTGALNSKTGSYATTGSNTFVGNQTITGNGTVTGDWTVQGNLIAQTFILSSSVSYFTQSFSSGSTKFGDHSFDTHQFTGSVRITGSLDITGSVTANYGFTGSLFGTSSWAQNAVGAPYYVLTSSFSTTSASISTRVTNLESTASAFVVASASFSSSIVTLTNASASLATNSGSNSTRFTLLESTASVLTTASASFSSSIATLTNASTSFAAVSTSYSTASGSLSSRVTVLETASGSLSASVATLINASASLAINSGSNSTRFTTLENASASFASQSGSNSTRFTILELASGSLSASVATLINMSASYAIASGSDSARITRLEGTASAFAIASASFSSSIVTLTNASTSFAAVSTSYSTASGSLSARTTLLEGTASIFATTSASIVANYVRNSQTSSMTVLSSSYAGTSSILLSSTGAIADTFWATNNGNGINFRIGDDAILGDVNIANTTQLSGLQSGGTGFIKFGSGSSPVIGTSGSNDLSIRATTITITGSVTATSLTGSHLGTSSYAVQAATASSVTILNQSVIITGSLVVGSGSAGVGEHTLILGPAPAGGAGEGGQLLLSARGDSGYTSASMWDNYQNKLRLLRGSNAGSDAEVASFNMHTKQIQFPAYNGSSAFPGTAVANLAVDSGGNVITISGVVSASYAATSSFANVALSGTGSFTGSFIGAHTGSLLGTSSYASQALSSSYSFSGSYALTASYVASIANLSTTQIATGSVTASVSGSDATFKIVSGSSTFLFVSSSGLTTVSGTFAVNVNNVNEFLISSTGSSLGNALTDIHSITGSLRVNGNITGSMFGTSSFAVSSSNALTASSVNPLNQTVSINGGLTVTGSTILSGSAGVTVLSANIDTIVFSGSFTSTGSVTITGSVNILGGVTGSLLGTSSYAVQALSSSYAITASYALNSTVNAFTYTQAASASTWTINHALNSRNLNVTVYDFGYNVIIPQNILNTDGNTSIVTFPSAQSGYAVLNPGGLLVTGSTAVFSASSAAVTWSFTHSLNTRVVNLDVYDASYNQVIPSRVTLTGLNTAEITFATATSGYAIASVNGNSGSVISSQNLVLTSDATDTTRYMTFAASQSGVTALFTDPSITLNPSTNTLTVGSLTETSTIELKQNIKNFVTPLAKFMALKPVSYKWKADKRKDIGFIAEQVQEIFPEIVAEDGKSMSYTKLTPILIDMVQRQQKMIEDMNQEIKELKKHINRT